MPVISSVLASSSLSSATLALTVGVAETILSSSSKMLFPPDSVTTAFTFVWCFWLRRMLVHVRPVVGGQCKRKEYGREVKIGSV